MGYFGGGDSYGADEYEEQDYYQPPPQRQNTPRSPGLRAAMRQMASENKALKQELETQKAMLQELMEGDAPQLSQGSRPVSRLTDAEQLQMEHMVSTGAMAAPPMGSQAEQIARIRNARSPQELADYLRSQGNTNGTMNYEGMGY